MPIIANAKKALRQTKTRTTRNRVVRAQVNSTVKKTNAKPNETSLTKLYSTLDRAVKRNIIHKNKAARLKSHAAKQVSAASKSSEKPVTSKAKSTKKVAKKTTKKTTAKKSTR